MTRLASAFGLSLQELLLEPEAPPPSPGRVVTGRRSITRFGGGRVVTNPFYDYAYYNVDLVDKQIVPMLGVVRARTLDEFGPLLRHPGEEFILVLEGQIEVHTEFYEPEILNVVDGVYIDSQMGHAYLSRVEGGSRVLAACTASADELTGELRKRDGGRSGGRDEGGT